MCEFKTAEKKELRHTKNKNGKVILVKLIASSIFWEPSSKPGAINDTKNGINKITHVVEKPKNPTSNYVLTGVNVFTPEIFDAIKKTKKGINNEIQLTDSIQTLIKSNYKIYASKMNSKDICIDIGTPKNYFKAIKYSFSHKNL